MHKSLYPKQSQQILTCKGPRSLADTCFLWYTFLYNITTQHDTTEEDISLLKIKLDKQIGDHAQI